MNVFLSAKIFIDVYMQMTLQASDLAYNRFVTLAPLGLQVKNALWR